MVKSIDENTSKNLSGKYSQKALDHAKNSPAEATSDLTGNKIADAITKVLETSSQNNSDTITNEHDKDIPKESYIFPEERQKNISRRKAENC